MICVDHVWLCLHLKKAILLLNFDVDQNNNKKDNNDNDNDSEDKSEEDDPNDLCPF